MLAAPEATRQWYEALTKDMGGDAGTMKFARLFLVPGMNHCGIQSGPGVANYRLRSVACPREVGRGGRAA